MCEKPHDTGSHKKWCLDWATMFVHLDMHCIGFHQSMSFLMRGIILIVIWKRWFSFLLKVSSSHKTTYSAQIIYLFPSCLMTSNRKHGARHSCSMWSSHSMLYLLTLTFVGHVSLSTCFDHGQSFEPLLQRSELWHYRCGWVPSTIFDTLLTTQPRSLCWASTSWSCWWLLCRIPSNSLGR